MEENSDCNNKTVTDKPLCELIAELPVSLSWDGAVAVEYAKLLESAYARFTDCVKEKFDRRNSQVSEVFKAIEDIVNRSLDHAGYKSKKDGLCQIRTTIRNMKGAEAMIFASVPEIKTPPSPKREENPPEQPVLQAGCEDAVLPDDKALPSPKREENPPEQPVLQTGCEDAVLPGERKVRKPRKASSRAAKRS